MYNTCYTHLLLAPTSTLCMAMCDHQPCELKESGMGRDSEGGRSPSLERGGKGAQIWGKMGQG